MDKMEKPNKKPFWQWFGWAAGLSALASRTLFGAEEPGSQTHPVKTAPMQDFVVVQRSLFPKPLTVAIELDAFSRLQAYVRHAQGELTLLGTAVPDRDRNQIRVNQLFLPYQLSSACATQVSEEDLARLLVEAVQAGVDVSSIKVWLHSHSDMPSYFSATDDRNILEAFPQAPWVLSIVINRAGEIKARFSLFSPIYIELDNLPVIIGLQDDLEENIRKEVKEKVRNHGGNHRASGSYPTFQPAGYPKTKPVTEPCSPVQAQEEKGNERAS
jgi:proteasome lid subunit RPN8/RPN11